MEIKGLGGTPLADQQIATRDENGFLRPVSPDNPIYTKPADDSGSGGGQTVTILGTGTAAGNVSYPSTGVADKNTDITIYFGGSTTGTTGTFSTFLIDINNRQTVLPGIRSNVSIAQVTTANVGDIVDYSIPKGCKLRIDYTAPTGGTLSIKGVE
ncbi:hypothetical protein [Paenibacillus pabuli]|uniref:hypothetical protein n=1 Tax=Paenibacillus pabuli TaxID=1472 RepID=UPI001FFEB51B|nr:hypothetical protein [Paenibacillus pabuli]UPK45871.1 hypothetical protein KET34_10640 [Paenibacillus pabuli]